MTTLLSTAPHDLAAKIRRTLPSGHLVPEHVWQSRHAAVLALLWLHIPLVLVFGAISRISLGHALVETSMVAAPAILASMSVFDRRSRSIVATFGLLVASTVLVHLSHGAIEMHFHYFIMLSVVALYQDWAPFLFSIAFVILQHGVLGILEPSSVFSHHEGRTDPWLWAGVHGSFVLIASVVNLTAWKISERYTLYDPLTDLANRALFHDRLDGALRRAVRLQENRAVLYIDLDRFKAVNDTFGHHAGDELLVRVGDRLRACTSPTDTVARLGGDEFGIVLANTGEATAATETAKQILYSLSQPFQLKAGIASIGASIGIALGRAEVVHAETFVRTADEAMYSAKQNGRGRYHLLEMPANSPLGSLGHA